MAKKNKPHFVLSEFHLTGPQSLYNKKLWTGLMYIMFGESRGTKVNKPNHHPTLPLN